MAACMPPLLLACLGLVNAGDVAAAGNFDGVYVGTQRITLSSDTAGCTNLDATRARLTVHNNHFTRTWGST